MQTLTQTTPIVMIGLNHKVAPVAVRERLAFGPEHIPVALNQIIGDDLIGIKEAVLLCTCNRTELYICTCDSLMGETRLHDFLADHAKLPPEQLQRMVYVLRGEAAAEHLMQVAAGLDSLVLGENEILGQVRSAAEMGQAAGATGPILSALFRYAIQAGKRARAETEIGRGDVSVASVVVELAEQALGPLHDRTALLIGAGKISAITARALVKAGLHCVMIANRTYERAEKLAKNLKGIAVHFNALDEVLTQADIVICSTGAPHIVLHAEAVAKAQQVRSDRPLLVADLAVPRDADPNIASIPGVHLTNIDDLEIIVKTGHPLTTSICQEVEAIVHQELEGFRHWYGARRCVPVIQALHSKAEAIYQAEVEQTLRRLGPLTPHQERLVQVMGKAIAGKLLHEPTVRLRELAPDEDLPTYLELIQVLYGIQ
ncbi:MAG: glutamyl-tRNA reductase [Anaerolineales bacterium]|nr:glutamyl-tRNA reductase [Anaerolineales bacterium]